MRTKQWIGLLVAMAVVSPMAFAAPDDPNAYDAERDQMSPMERWADELGEGIAQGFADEMAELLPRDTEVHGFLEMRAGWRLQDDAYEDNRSITETRLQLDVFHYLEEAELKFKGDVYGDYVMEEAEFDLREAFLFTRVGDSIDLKVGRQVLTWGTGDMIFINDLFPKDWQSFFIGRDTEYLKAPSDAAKVSWFSDAVNVDFVYTPQFDPDRFIRGERLSYYNPKFGRIAGEDRQVDTVPRDGWLTEDEMALRLYRTIENYEVAGYGYWGYWKSPKGIDDTGRFTHPRLNVYGLSGRGTLGKGIANVELGYYQSSENESGRDPMLPPSEMRYLAGYTQELARNLTGGVQYNVEQIINYNGYRDNLPGSTPRRDEWRHLITFRLTQLLLNQNLTCSLFTYYSPSDEDVYMRPRLSYKVTDQLLTEIGANVFFGRDEHVFFGQFEDNTNMYFALRYSF